MEHFEIEKKPAEKKTALFMVILGFTLLGGLIQVVNWDKYALSVIPLQTSVLFGSATIADHEAFSQICLERKKYDCAKDHLMSLVKSDSQNLEAQLSLGLLQVRMSELPAAKETLGLYLENGGDDPRAKFNLAKVLTQQDQIGEALKIYKNLLRSKTGVFQVSVTKEYIRTLMQAKKWKLAKAAIQQARLRSQAHNAFMASEYLAVKQQLRHRQVASQNL